MDLHEDGQQKYSDPGSDQYLCVTSVITALACRKVGPGSKFGRVTRGRGILSDRNKWSVEVPYNGALCPPSEYSHRYAKNRSYPGTTKIQFRWFVTFPYPFFGFCALAEHWGPNKFLFSVLIHVSFFSFYEWGFLVQTYTSQDSWIIRKWHLTFAWTGSAVECFRRWFRWGTGLILFH